VSVALLRYKSNVTINDNYINRPNEKGRAPLEALPCTAMLADLNFVAYVFEALPFSMPLNLTVGTGDASVDEVCECNYRQCRSNHRAPAFQLACYIDSHVTSQVLIFVLTLEVGFTGINVSLILVIGVVLSFIFGHVITSLILLSLVFRSAYQQDTAGNGFSNVSRLAAGW